MKKSLLIMALALGTCASQATTVCSVVAENPAKSLTFDRKLFNDAITSPTAILVKKDLSSAEVLDLSQLNTLEKVEKVNGDTLVTFQQTEGGSYNIGVATIDASKAETNVFQLETMAIGAVTDKQDLQLIISRLTTHLSLVCTQL